ncbi:MAG TPA: DNA-directed RNA polymerase subunit omega [Pyrinomonadaceae bacterium]
MAKAVESKSDLVGEETADVQPQEIDSKYRLIIVAAQRSKQLQRGARPRVDFDTARHKPTRIALEEVMRGYVTFETIEKEKD